MPFEIYPTSAFSSERNWVTFSGPELRFSLLKVKHQRFLSSLNSDRLVSAELSTWNYCSLGRRRRRAAETYSANLFQLIQRFAPAIHLDELSIKVMVHTVARSDERKLARDANIPGFLRELVVLNVTGRVEVAVLSVLHSGGQDHTQKPTKLCLKSPENFSASCRKTKVWVVGVRENTDIGIMGMDDLKKVRNVKVFVKIDYNGAGLSRIFSLYLVGCPHHSQWNIKPQELVLPKSQRHPIQFYRFLSVGL